jgi:hypothetical protein
MSNEENSEAPKKPYNTPRLHLYGDVRVITQAGGGGKASDGGQLVALKTRG